MYESYQQVSDEVTARIIKTHGSIDMKCAQATTHLMRAAKKADLPLIREVGFVGMSIHHWARTPDGTIVDPTGGQMVGGWNGVITADDAQWCQYQTIAPDLVDIVARYPSSMQYFKWVELEGAARHGLNYLYIDQDEVEEVRVNRFGKKYFFQRFSICWEMGDKAPKISSITIMPCKDGKKVDLLIHFKKRSEVGLVLHWHARYLGIPMEDEFGINYMIVRKVSRTRTVQDYVYGLWLGRYIENFININKEV